MARGRTVNIRMTADFSGESGIVTGAGSGMGRDIAIRLAGAGASLILADVNFDAALQVQNTIVESGGRACALKADVREAADVEHITGTCLERYTHIDFLISNAGIVGPYEFEDTTPEEWDNVIAVNTRAGFLCARSVLPHMKRRRRGRIVFNASTNGGKPGGHVIAYRVSKAALIMLARSLALHTAPYGITVNAVCPGVTMTPIQRSLIESLLDEREGSFDEYVEEREKRVPMGRFTSMRDVTDMVEFLLSDNASFVTGQALFVNGGEW
jgi:NAD(P)-dependent dehydrogenase (short-subunit alcohol dehydrogenase family)